VWRSPSGRPARSYTDLAELALGEARLALAAEEGALVEIFDRANSDTSLELRLEVLSERDGRVVVLATDVTERVRREAELLQTREALLQKEQLRVLGELTTSVTHDIGNTLRAIQARLTALGTELSSGAHHSMLADLSRALDEALRSLRQLHQTARTGRLTPVLVHLDELVGRAAAVLHLDAFGTEGITLHTQLDGLPAVMGTPAELSHLFITLLRNAREAMPKGGQIDVSGSVRSGTVVVRVADEGTGIPDEVMPRLFEPFFTTKGENGTGLGLWLAASTMRRLGGAIRASNRRRGGTVFTLSFPIAAAGKAKVKKRPQAPRPRLPARRVPA
jgi:signal transduction histidine kinase